MLSHGRPVLCAPDGRDGLTRSRIRIGAQARERERATSSHKFTMEKPTSLLDAGPERQGESLRSLNHSDVMHTGKRSQSACPSNPRRMARPRSQPRNHIGRPAPCCLSLRGATGLSHPPMDRPILRYDGPRLPLPVADALLLS